jgi:hypothetical protein
VLTLNQVCGFKFQFFTGSPIHPPLGALSNRYRDVDAINDHLALIKDQNDHIAKLDAKIAECELEN